MRKTLTLSLLLVKVIILNAQFGFFETDFEDRQTIDLQIDTINNPDNIWHIGEPTKPLFNKAHSEPNCIFTDTSAYYPTNDTSSFVITHYASNGYTYPHTANIAGYYKIDSDTINDFGMIEFSPNNGRKWYDLLNVEFADDIWNYRIPVFSGHIDQWTRFDVDLAYFHQFEDFQEGDTLLIKFSFVSDSIQNNREGWFIDNIYMNDVAEGIQLASGNSFESMAYPNPVKDRFEIKFSSSGYAEFLLSVYDATGRLVYESIVGSDGSILLGKDDIGETGSFIYHIYSKDRGEHSSGKFLLQ